MPPKKKDAMIANSRKHDRELFLQAFESRFFYHFQIFYDNFLVVPNIGKISIII